VTERSNERGKSIGRLAISDALKRSFDLLAASGGLFVFAPIIVLGIVLVRLESYGPGLFAQTRIGRFGQPFICYKIRTMYSDTIHRPSHEISAAAITPLGAHLRRWKFDELPQLFNVIRGDMSLVGPRPCLESQQTLIEARRRRGVLSLRPGITGEAQVRGVDMSDPERLAAVDAEYLNTVSLVRDVKLILMTAFGAGRGDAAHK